MISGSLCRGILIIVLCGALVAPARANTSLKTAATEIVVGIAAGVALATVLVVVLVRKARRPAITGCVSSGKNGVTITDEKNRQIYALSGDTSAIQPGDRMKLKGKKVKAKGTDKTPIWEAKAVTMDFGACQP